MGKRAKGEKLTPKEEAVIRDIVGSVRAGESFTPAKSFKKIYSVKDSTAKVMASQKMRLPDFREALMTALEERKIIGADSKVEEVLTEGLDALTDKGDTDFKTRLDYVKEINKIAGVYAPERHESKRMTLNMDMTKEELDERISSLQKELEDI